MASRTGVSTDKVLKVHVATDGGVWYAEGDGSPVDAQAAPGDFLGADVCRRARRIRMTGSATNAALLVCLIQRKRAGELHRLEVASPAVIGRTRAERRDPRVVLTRISDAVADGLTPALGGWHEFVDRDLPAYFLAASEGDDDPAVAQARQLALWEHPAWRALSFIPHLDEVRLASLLGIVLDPRWFASLRIPKRGSDIVSFSDDSARLHAYLGLTPQTVAGVLGVRPHSGEHERCSLVVGAWTGGRPGSPATIAAPGEFLWRRFAREDGPIKALLRASQLFVDFLRLVWLDALYTDRSTQGRAAPGMRPAREGLFAPDHFFATDWEADGFARHLVPAGGN